MIRKVEPLVTLSFRAMEEEDLMLVEKWLGERDAMEAFGFHFPFTRSEMLEWYRKNFAGKNGHALILQLSESQDPIGFITISGIDWINRYCVLDRVYVKNEFRRKQIAYKAMKSLLKLIFDGWGLFRVETIIPADNIRGMELFRKLGFVEEGRLAGRFFMNGQFVDAAMMALTLNGWRRRETVNGTG